MTKRQRRRLNQQHQLVVGNGDFKMPNLAKAAKKAVKSAMKNHPDLVRKGFTAGGAAIGSRLGSSAMGAKVGNAIGRALVSGHGDYVLHGNSLLSNNGTIVPTFAPDGRRGIRIREREFIGDVFSGSLDPVSGSTAFNNKGYAINPSDPNTFPWLSGIATQFEQWEPNGIIFEYVSTSSNFNGTSQALGAVIAATEYNSADSNYATKAEMENAAYAISAKASENIMHGVECDPSERPTRLLFCGTFDGTPTSNNLHDLGRFQLATRGMSVANVNVGELWVTYDITFYKKQIPREIDITPAYYQLEKLGATTITAAELLAAIATDPRDSKLVANGSNLLFRAPPRSNVLFMISYNIANSQTFTGTGVFAGPLVNLGSNAQVSAANSQIYIWCLTQADESGVATVALTYTPTVPGVTTWNVKVSAESVRRGRCPVGTNGL